MKFAHLLAFVRPRCHALIAPQAVVLEVASAAPPLLRPSVSAAPGPEQQLLDAVALLLQMLDQAQVAGRRLQLVVSDYWARPAMLRLPDESASDAGIDDLLARHYRSSYGALMDGWRWCWDQQGSQVTAVAWPHGALTALRVGLAQRGCVLAQARPLGLVLARQLADEPGAFWLLILTSACATLMRQQDGVLQDWCMLTGQPDRALGLPLQLAREAARRGDACRAVVILDFDHAAELPLMRQNLLAAGWATRVAEPDVTPPGWAVRLQQVAESPGTA